jgi:coenzyme F420-reducing hydrogenase gamma subunit
MYLNRIRPPKPKFVEEVTKAEFVPEEPVIKDYSLLPYAELKKLAAEKGIKTTRNSKKSELIKLLGGEDVGQD